MKTMLLPHYMRIIGWILFVPCLVVGVLILVEVLSLNGVVGVVVNDTAIIGIAIGALFICCSRERQEDEMVQAVRLQALMMSLPARARHRRSPSYDRFFGPSEIRRLRQGFAH